MKNNIDTEIAITKEPFSESFSMIDNLNIDPMTKLSLYKQLCMDIFRESSYKKSENQIQRMNSKDLEIWADKFARSNLCPKHLSGKPIDVFMTVEMGYELRLKPLQAIKTIGVINGIPFAYGDGKLALIKRQSNIFESISERFEGDIKSNTFTAYCTVKRKGEEAVTRIFNIEKAITAGLWKKSGPWTLYPDRMIQRKARNLALDDVFPDILFGLLSEDDAHDLHDHLQPQKDITPLKKGNEGVRQILGIPKENTPLEKQNEKIDNPVSGWKIAQNPHQTIYFPSDNSDFNESEDIDELATPEEVEKLGKLVVEKGLITQQTAWLAKAKVGSMSELKQKTVRALIERYSGEINDES